MLGEKEYIMWLSGLKRVSYRKKKILLDIFGSAKGIFTAKESSFQKIKVLNESNLEDIFSHRNENKLEIYAERVYSDEIEYITYDSRYYPDILGECYEPPFGFYLKGDKEVLLENKISMVGTRRATTC